MAKKISPFNSWGESFWTRHFKCFKFLRLICAMLMDLLEEKMIFPALSMYIIGYYYIDLNTELLVIYEAQAICQPLYPNYLNVPDFLLLGKSKFSRYSHYFYPLILIGNIKKTSFFITLLCAAYCVYDFILVFIDVLYK